MPVAASILFLVFKVENMTASPYENASEGMSVHMHVLTQAQTDKQVENIMSPCSFSGMPEAKTTGPSYKPTNSIETMKSMSATMQEHTHTKQPALCDFSVLYKYTCLLTYRVNALTHYTSTHNSEFDVQPWDRRLQDFQNAYA